MNAPIARLPIMPLKEVVMFPNGVVPLSVGRDFSTQAIWNSIKKYDRLIFTVTQRENTEDIHLINELYDVGTVCKIASICECPYKDTGGLKVIFHGLYRGRLFSENSRNSRNKSKMISDITHIYNFTETKNITQKYSSEVYEARRELFFTQWKLTRMTSPYLDEIHDVYSKFSKDDLSTNTGLLADTVIQHLKANYHEKQDILETTDEIERFQKVYSVIHTRLENEQNNK